MLFPAWTGFGFWNCNCWCSISGAWRTGVFFSFFRYWFFFCGGGGIWVCFGWMRYIPTCTYCQCRATCSIIKSTANLKFKIPLLKSSYVYEYNNYARALGCSAAFNFMQAHGNSRYIYAEVQEKLAGNYYYSFNIYFYFLFYFPLSYPP